MRPVLALFFVPLLACSQTTHTLSAAARQEVYSTATCASIEVSHVPSWERDDVYAAEGCGNRWLMTCESKHAVICPRRSRHCHTELQWTCDNVQADSEMSDDELRARVSHPDDMNLLGS